MSVKRWVLLGVIAGCVILVLLSLAGLWERRAKAPERPAPPSQAGQTPAGEEQAQAEPSMEFFKLTMPYASENRTIAELYLPYGKKLVKTRKLLAENGRLTIFREEKDEKGKPRTIVVNFDMAEVNEVDNSAILEKKVDVELQEGIHLKTTRVSWDPAHNLVSTDQPVKITGQDLDISGVGMFANVKEETATLQKEVRALLKTGAGPLVPGAKREPGAAKKPAPAKAEPKKLREVLITCDAEMSGKRAPLSVAFNKNVRVRSETFSLDTDFLDIRFAQNKAKTEAGQKRTKGASVLAESPAATSIEMITAKGSVLFKDEMQEATGDEMVWDAAKRCATLKGKTARFRQGENSITAETLVYHLDQSTLSVPSGGELVFQTKGDLISARSGLGTGRAKESMKKDAVTSTMRVTWAKDMVYEKNRAVFRDRVTAQQGQSILTANTLEVGFDDQDKVKSLLALGGVSVSHEGRQALGNRLEWTAESGVAWLTGDPSAEVREAESFLGCPKIGFYSKENRIECLGAGYLLASPKIKESKPAKKKEKPRTGLLATVPAGKPTEDAAAGKIRVTWTDRMIFEMDQHVATFHKDIHASRDDLRIGAETLRVVFDEDNKKVTKLVGEDPKGGLRLEHSQGTGSGARVEWDAADETASLFGSPRAVVVMKDRERRLEAPKIFVDTREEAIHTEGGGLLHSPADKSKEKKKEGSLSLSDDLNITWTDTLDFERASQQAVFKGKVTARSGKNALDADALTVQFEEAEKKAPSGPDKAPSVSLKRIVADGHVKMRQGDEQQGSGDRFVWDAASDVATLEGKPAQASGALQKQAYRYYIEGALIKILKVSQDKKDIRVSGEGLLRFSLPKLADAGALMKGEKSGDVSITWRDRMVFDQISGKGFFEWNTEVTYGTHKVQSRKLEVALTDDNHLDKVHAIGNVYLQDTEEQQEATGDTLVWNRTQNQAVLTGNPDASIWFGTQPREKASTEKKTEEGATAKKEPQAEKPKDAQETGLEERLRIRCEGRVSSSLEVDAEKGSRIRTQAKQIIITGLFPSQKPK